MYYIVKLHNTIFNHNTIYQDKLHKTYDQAYNAFIDCENEIIDSKLYTFEPVKHWSKNVLKKKTKAFN